MIKDDSVPPEQSAQEETHPEGLNHDDPRGSHRNGGDWSAVGAPVEGYMHLLIGLLVTLTES